MGSNQIIEPIFPRYRSNLEFGNQIEGQIRIIDASIRVVSTISSKKGLHGLLRRQVIMRGFHMYPTKINGIVTIILAIIVAVLPLSIFKRSLSQIVVVSVEFA